MRNRAKCKLCNDVIESKSVHEFVWCKCKEIAVDGGQEYFKCIAGSWSNFIRVADDDSEIPVKTPEPSCEGPVIEPPTYEERLGMLDAMIESIESLPPHAASQPASNYDLCAALILLRSLFRDKL